MDISQKGIKFIEEHEGCKLKSYQDSGHIWTIGYGHTGKDVYPNMVITQKQADNLFKIDIESRVKLLNQYIKCPYNQNQFDALLSFLFNAGLGSLLMLIKSTGIDNQLGNILNVPAHLSQYNKIFNSKTGHYDVCDGLTNRRKAELKLFNGEI